MTGDQEPEETLMSPVITMYSNVIFPCPRRHFSSNCSSNGKSYVPGVNEPVRGRRWETHIGVILEVCDVPVDSFGDFLDQLTFGHRFCLGLVILGRELSAYLLTTAQFWTFNLYAPALTLPLDFHSPWPAASVSSRHRCWKGTLETGYRR